jgi:hypothetical protein
MKGSTEMRNTLPVAAALLGCALLTGGCALDPGYPEYTKPLTDSQLIGHWVSTCKAVLNVNPDHTLTATGLPTGDDPVKRTIIGNISGHGTWSIQPAFGDTIPQAMQITVGDQGDALVPAINNGSLLLVDTLGDPDDGIACNFSRG